MADLHVRDLDERVLRELERRARSRGMTVDALVLECLERSLGVPAAARRPVRHDDLHALAGQWTEDEARAFAQAVAPFGAVDREQWPV